MNEITNNLMSVWRARYVLDDKKMHTRRKTKIHATQKGADYTYCGIECVNWEHWGKTDGSDVTCKRCRKSIASVLMNDT